MRGKDDNEKKLDVVLPRVYAVHYTLGLSTNPVRFSFRLSKQDLAAFQKLANRRLTVIAKANPKLLVANLIAWIPLGIAIAAYAAMYRKYPDLTHDLSIVLAAVVLGAVLLVLSMIYKQHIYRGAVLSEDGWFLTEQTIDADSEGLKIENPTSRSSYKWTSFVHSAEDSSNLYLFLDNAQALIIPKSAIGSPEQLAQFRSWSRVGEP